jgi:hypothetical protein
LALLTLQQADIDEVIKKLEYIAKDLGALFWHY